MGALKDPKRSGKEPSQTKPRPARPTPIAAPTPQSPAGPSSFILERLRSKSNPRAGVRLAGAQPGDKWRHRSDFARYSTFTYIAIMRAMFAPLPPARRGVGYVKSLDAVR